MNDPEDDLLPLSGLQHLAFCERQCALIHVEGIWRENRLTAQGRFVHEAAHEEGRVRVRSTTIQRGMALTSRVLGLSGRSDVVEIHHDRQGGASVVPVEYKRGGRRPRIADDIQVCAQAMCLEEMLGLEVATGAIFHAASRRRREVALTPELRAATVAAAARFHDLVAKAFTPRPAQGPRCRSCSLAEICLPGFTGSGNRATEYVNSLAGSVE